MEDNMYPTSTERLFKTPQKQQEREKKAKIAYEAERPHLQKIMEHLQNKREEYASVTAIQDTKDTEKFMIEVRTNQKLVEILDDLINYIGGLIKKYEKD